MVADFNTYPSAPAASTELHGRQVVEHRERDDRRVREAGAQPSDDVVAGRVRQHEAGDDDVGLDVDASIVATLVACATTSRSGSWSISARRPSRKIV